MAVCLLAKLRATKTGGSQTLAGQSDRQRDSSRRGAVDWVHPMSRVQDSYWKMNLEPEKDPEGPEKAENPEVPLPECEAHQSKSCTTASQLTG